MKIKFINCKLVRIVEWNCKSDPDTKVFCEIGHMTVQKNRNYKIE